MNTLVVLIKFVNTYVANVKSDIVENKRTSLLKINNKEYTEARTRAGMLLLLTSLDGLVYRKFTLIEARFGPESIFKKWLLLFFGFILLCFCFI